MPDYIVKDITLPSGKEVQIMIFRTGPLEICPGCQSHLVYPISWYEETSGDFSIELVCPECWWTAKGNFCAESANHFNGILDEAQTAQIEKIESLAKEVERNLRALEAIQEEEIDRFVFALESEGIVPFDF